MLLPSIYPKRNEKKNVQKRAVSIVFTEILFRIAKSGNKPNVTNSKYVVFIHVRKYYLKKITIDPCSNMIGFQKNLDKKKYILCNSIYIEFINI